MGRGRGREGNQRMYSKRFAVTEESRMEVAVMQNRGRSRETGNIYLS